MMKKDKFIIIIIAIFISNLNCNKDVTLPEVITIGVRAGTDMGFVNYTGEGKVISDGGVDLISKGVCFSSVNTFPTFIDSINPSSDSSDIEYHHHNGSCLDIADNGSISCRLDLALAQKYYIRAFAENKAGISYGDTVTYTTYCYTDFDIYHLTRTPVFLTFPSDGATGLPLSVKLEWSSMYYYKGFDIYLDTLPDAPTKIASDVKSLSYNIDGLISSTTYYWKIVKLMYPCTDISSQINSFTTIQ